jgi:hypothetical protein
VLQNPCRPAPEPQNPCRPVIRPAAPLEDVLRTILHGRNYALVYDGGADVSQVILLAPSSAGAPGRPVHRARVPPRAKQKKAADRGPVVVRF